MSVSEEPRSWKPREVIDRRSAEDLRYWSERLGVDEGTLRETIAEVGPRAAAVATELGCVLPADELRA